MNYKPFPESFWKQIKQAVAAARSITKSSLYAAFDADGTLWDTDLGENFFQYQIDHNCVDLPKDPWAFYQELKKKNGDPREAYLWLAQINKKQPLAQVRLWSQAAFDDIRPSPLFADQKKLVEFLLSENVHIFIVTASVAWAVEPGARAMGLSEKNVIGIETEIKDLTVSEIPIYPVTYKQGKVDAFLKRSGGVLPFLACGNTTGDTELLKSSTEIKLAVSAASRDDRLFHSESELQKIAVENNWLTHRFI